MRLVVESGSSYRIFDYSGSPLLRGHRRACVVHNSASLSYLSVVWRTAQQSFTSLCFCVTRAASAGCRLESWETLTSSIWNHTERQENKRRRQAGVWHGAGPWTNVFRVSVFTARLAAPRVTKMGCEFWIAHHDLTGNVPNFPVSGVFHSVACREAFSLDEKLKKESKP